MPQRRRANEVAPRCSEDRRRPPKLARKKRFRSAHQNGLLQHFFVATESSCRSLYEYPTSTFPQRRDGRVLFNCREIGVVIDVVNPDMRLPREPTEGLPSRLFLTGGVKPVKCCQSVHIESGVY